MSAMGSGAPANTHSVIGEYTFNAATGEIRQSVTTGSAPGFPAENLSNDSPAVHGSSALRSLRGHALG